MGRNWEGKKSCVYTCILISDAGEKEVEMRGYKISIIKSLAFEQDFLNNDESCSE